MSISWGSWAVRVYAAEAWVSLGARFAFSHPIIIDHLERFLDDRVPAVRLQAAQNLQVIHSAAPERMWVLGEKIAKCESDAQVLAFYLNGSLLRFSHRDPERCEALLGIVKERIDDDISVEMEGRDQVLECLGGWTAQLFVGQGRTLTLTWLEEWVGNPEKYREFLDSFVSSLREALFDRYRSDADARAEAVSDRAQHGLEVILKNASGIVAEAYSVIESEADETEKGTAKERCIAAERVIHHAMNQIYFGSGAYSNNSMEGKGLSDTDAMARFFDDYGNVLDLVACTREPATLHQLIELYEFLIPGDPETVLDALHALLLGRGEEEGYHYESLGQKAVVRIVERFIADHRAIFEDEARRSKLVAILQLFSKGGWPDALRLLYDLPDLLR